MACPFSSRTSRSPVPIDEAIHEMYDHACCCWLTPRVKSISMLGKHGAAFVRWDPFNAIEDSPLHTLPSHKLIPPSLWGLLLNGSGHCRVWPKRHRLESASAGWNVIATNLGIKQIELIKFTVKRYVKFGPDDHVGAQYESHSRYVSALSLVAPDVRRSQNFASCVPSNLNQALLSCSRAHYLYPAILRSYVLLGLIDKVLSMTNPSDWTRNTKASDTCARLCTEHGSVRATSTNFLKAKKEQKQSRKLKSVFVFFRKKKRWLLHLRRIWQRPFILTWKWSTNNARFVHIEVSVGPSIFESWADWPISVLVKNLEYVWLES